MRNIINPVIRNLRESGKPLFNNANRIARVLYRFAAYRKIVLQVLRKKVPLFDLVRSQFPFLLPDASAPPIVSIEFTNACNLRCVYCSSSLYLRPKGMMSTETFSKVVKSLKDLSVSRVRVVGNGEPTLHPKFPRFVSELARSVRFLSLVTNGQWRSEEIPYVMLKAPVDLIEISVDAGDKERYETSRIGGKFDKLLHNFRLLQKARKELHPATLINIRLMLRPSQRTEEKQLTAYWRAYADTVMPQYIFKRKDVDYSEDIYLPIHQETQEYPKCTVPFKMLDINWNGDIPLCSESARQIGPPGLILGNINECTLKEIWYSQIMRQYRNGHRNRKLYQIPICKGCIGC